MFKIFINYPDDSACTYYRSILPYYYCREELLKHGIELVMGREVEDNCDAYMFHRIANPAFVFRLERIAKNRKLIWDIDDNVFCIPEWSPAHVLMNNALHDMVRHCMNLARWNTVATERLGEQMKSQVGVNPVVLPNLINFHDFNSNASRGEPPCIDMGGPLRILWAGSDSHSEDVRLIASAANRIIEKHKKNVMFIFMGMIPEGMETGNSVTFVPALPLNSFQNLLSLIRPHIGLTPLCDHEFNVGKSNIKFLEMTAAGGAVLSSEFGPYADSIKDQVDGIFCKNDDDWFEYMDYLYHHRERAKEFNRIALAKVKRRYSWESSEEKWKWINFFISVKES